MNAKQTLKDDFTFVLRGMAMGAADVVPGVSGGTMALILGVYERLVTALSRFDTHLLSHLRHGELRQAAAHVDLRFLVGLGVGVLAGIVALGGAVNFLLTNIATRPFTLSVFFGMILASAVVVVRMIPVSGAVDAVRYSVVGLLAAAFAYWLTGSQVLAIEPTLPFVFACGMVAICAMILPGISGAYVLLILGLYGPLTDILKALPRGNVTGADVAIVAVFASGCAIGLLGFSKILRLLLDRYSSMTMAILAGLMLGALRKIWPFQHDLSPPNAHGLKEMVFVNYWPAELAAETWMCGLAAVVAAVAVLLTDHKVRGAESSFAEG